MATGSGIVPDCRSAAEIMGCILIVRDFDEEGKSTSVVAPVSWRLNDSNFKANCDGLSVECRRPTTEDRRLMLTNVRINRVRHRSRATHSRRSEERRVGKECR